MTKDDKLELLREVFDEDEDVLREDVVLVELDSWNSMTQLSLVVMMDEEFDKDLTAAAIRKFVTVNDILNYME